MEYRSKAEFLGLPLVHVCLAEPSGQGWSRRHARGWIAVGDTAWGVLFAAGGGAIGLVAVGGGAIGVLAIGGGALGLVSLGGMAIGGLALGGCAVGHWAIGGAAFGLQAALGGLAVAKEFAIGGSAQALHANDEAAKAFFAHQALLRAGRAVMENAEWFLLALVLPIWVGLRGRQKREVSG